MATTGQTINDRLNAVRYALVGQGLARTVCKATTEEVLGPKKKHIEYLLACTNEPNVSIPQLANLLIERSAHTNWAVVFKSLITMHHLMSYGNERFTQYLATSNYSFELADFMDRTTPQGYNMSTFVRKYAKYINEKAISYRSLAIDLCKIRSGSENALRTMNMDNLSKTLPIVQSQFDSLLDFSAESKDLNNGIITSAFRLLYKDLVKLYVAYQEAIINLLERYFKLSRKKTREALEMYKKYLARMDKVAGFLHVVEAVGLDKSEMPDLTKSPASILKLLEQHLAQLEAKKRGTTPANEDDEPTTVGDDNKENNEPDTKVTSEEAATSKVAVGGAETHPPQPKELATSGGDAAGTSAPATTTKPSASEKQAPPQKPARPSPKASPKVSPTYSGSAKPVPPKQSSPAAETPPAPVPPSAPAEKKVGPPERPAKPPSRPPPPTATAPAPSSSSPKSETPAGSSSQTTVEHGRQAQAKVVAHSPPPPHPPPPHPHPPAATPPAAQSASAPTSQQHPLPTPNEPMPTPEPQPELVAQEPREPDQTPPAPGPSTQAATQETINTASATNGGAADHAAASSSEGGAASPTSAAATSCSATMAANNVVAAEAADEAQDLETNHVNNVTNNNNNNNVEQAALEEEMPPPPPPLEDLEEGAAAGEPEEHQVVDPVPGQAAEIDPVVNGEYGNNAG